MLSNMATSSIQKRRTQHRRQNSTPAAFEAPKVRALPANIQRRHNRTGMSLDLRGLNLENILASERGSIPDPLTPVKIESYQQDDSTVSITNIGQPQQHTMQVAQTHSMGQPGSPLQYSHSSEHQYPQSPQTPHQSLHQQQPPQPAPPTEQQLKELHEHISKVYGSYGQVFVNILPTPITTPQKPARLPSHEPLDTAPMPSNLSDMAEINLDPPGSSDLNFSFENPESDMGYESSSYYASDPLSPGQSPCASPQQKSSRTFVEDVEEEYATQMAFSNPPPLFPDGDINGLPHSFTDSMQRSSSIVDPEIDASIEYTGIAPEDVQRFISEQDMTTGRWTCLFSGCDKTFGRRENIRSHVQTHLGDRQYRCNGCGKCFVRQHDLKRHAKIHTGSKPYKCPCSAGFARQDALTRHRQRGMCVGGFPDAVRRQAKRGRPKKNRPGMEDRVKKSSKTRRRALASASSSSSGGSPSSDFSSSRHQSPPSYSSTNEVVESGSSLDTFGGPLSASTDPWSFDNASSPYSHASPTSIKFQASSPFENDETSMNLLRHLSAEGFAQTPPMSPNDHASSQSQDNNSAYGQNKSVEKLSTTPSRTSIHSNAFTTPPTSPVEATDANLDDLFHDFDNSGACSQYDLEMKAMSDFTSFDNNEPYEMLDFM